MKGNSMRLVSMLIDALVASGHRASLAAPISKELIKKSLPDSNLKLEQLYFFENAQACIACDECAEAGICIFDDAIPEIQDAARRADALVWISPLYFASVPSQLKVLIDRGQALYQKNLLEGSLPKDQRKPAWLVIVGGGGDPYGYLAAVPPISYASRMMDAELEPELVLIGPDAIGDIDAKAFESFKESARNFFDRIASELS